MDKRLCFPFQLKRLRRERRLAGTIRSVFVQYRNVEDKVNREVLWQFQSVRLFVEISDAQASDVASSQSPHATRSQEITASLVAKLRSRATPAPGVHRRSFCAEIIYKFCFRKKTLERKIRILHRDNSYIAPHRSSASSPDTLTDNSLQGARSDQRASAGGRAACLRLKRCWCASARRSLCRQAAIRLLVRLCSFASIRLADMHAAFYVATIRCTYAGCIEPLPTAHSLLCAEIGAEHAGLRREEHWGNLHFPQARRRLHHTAAAAHRGAQRHLDQHTAASLQL